MTMARPSFQCPAKPLREIARDHRGGMVVQRALLPQDDNNKLRSERVSAVKNTRGQILCRNWSTVLSFYSLKLDLALLSNRPTTKRLPNS